MEVLFLEGDVLIDRLVETLAFRYCWYIHCVDKYIWKRKEKSCRLSPSSLVCVSVGVWEGIWGLVVLFQALEHSSFMNEKVSSKTMWIWMECRLLRNFLYNSVWQAFVSNLSWSIFCQYCKRERGWCHRIEQQFTVLFNGNLPPESFTPETCSFSFHSNN